MPTEKTIPLDSLIYEFLEFCFEQNDELRLVYQGGKSSKGSTMRAVFSNVLSDETYFSTYDDIAKALGMRSRDGIKRHLSKHFEYIEDEQYAKIFRELKSLVDMFRAKKSALFKLGEPSAGYDKYECEHVAQCYKTGEGIRYGDFVSGTTQGGNQFTGIPLTEIGKGVLGVENHLICVPLFLNKDYEDVITLEKLRLEHKSPLEWRYAI